VSEPSVVDVGPSDSAPGACLVWRFDQPVLAISSSIVGGGIGPVSWVINLTVDTEYSRLDPVEHLGEVADRLALEGRGIGLMTAVDVGKWTSAMSEEAVVFATVGVSRPVWAADSHRPPSSGRAAPGTINLVAFVPVRMSEAALVNAVATITEAKVQAMAAHEVPGTGTASDAVCVLCDLGGDEEPFGGTRSTWGGRLAQAAFEAVAAGIVRQRA